VTLGLGLSVVICTMVFTCWFPQEIDTLDLQLRRVKFRNTSSCCQSGNHETFEYFTTSPVMLVQVHYLPLDLKSQFVRNYMTSATQQNFGKMNILLSGHLKPSYDTAERSSMEVCLTSWTNCKQSSSFQKKMKTKMEYCRIWSVCAVPFPVILRGRDRGLW
jgi:hypothetical protein